MVFIVLNLCELNIVFDMDGANTFRMELQYDATQSSSMSYENPNMCNVHSFLMHLMHFKHLASSSFYGFIFAPSQ